MGLPIVSLEEPLSKGELELLKKLLEVKRASFEELSKLIGIPITSIASLSELLKSRGLVEIEEKELIYAKTTDEGVSYIDSLPEERVVKILEALGGSAPITAIEEKLGRSISSIGIGWAKRRGWISIEKGVAKLLSYEPLIRHRQLLSMFREYREVPKDLIEDPILKELVKRRLIVLEKKKIKIIKLIEDRIDIAKKLVELGEGIPYLTHELLASGRWRSIRLKPYNVEALPPRIYPGKKHFFKEFIDMVREVMLSLGFEEIRDDYVVPEFWNFDALFQAQDHPSRDIHDVLFVEGRADLSPLRDIVERARAVHEYGGDTGSRGWGYRWSIEKASKLLLRSHTTAVTIKYLAYHNEPPVRAFVIGRVFRRDSIDAKHLPEFTNFDGIIMEKDFSFRKLLGLLTQIIRALGIEKLKFKPGYFPFTEPSVEGYVYIEGIGWIEVFGAGMFRPEVLRIANVRYPVGAWGMGLERLAMAIYGINDIRLLYSRDVEFLRSFTRVKGLSLIR